MGMRDFQRQMRALAEINQANENNTQQSTVVAHGNDYAVLEIACKNDVNAIRAFPTRAEKNDYKRDRFLPKWLPFVEQYFEQGSIYQNDYLVYCIVYLFDIADFDRALSLAEKAILQNQAMPEGWQSTLPNFVADQIYNWTDKTAAAGQSVEPYFTQTFKNVATRWQLHEIVTAKWLKLAAALLLRNPQGNVQASGIDDAETLLLAIQLCNRAFQLNPKAGVKNMIERCTMRLNALAKAGEYDPQRLPQVSGLSLEQQPIDFDLVVEKLLARPLENNNGENHV
ncbi:phage terminase small subunit [Rodentibacter haemolyticus]|uniref:Terminase endonuclease subunit n=1 Tax=Rodentibacter haemolyticus TaxID=2778911 RepID=A0ABX6UY76_9PAST|nr:terminase endonuclease subunit [Rodentibacter haemolyticus]QPB43062.1 terminase endonuclease subunit [Rodentibacter haemolyticus]